MEENNYYYNNKIIVKVHNSNKEEIRRFSVEKNITFSKLFRLICFICKLKNASVKYSDDEKELITITCDLELKEAIQFFSQQKNSNPTILRLYVENCKYFINDDEWERFFKDFQEKVSITKDEEKEEKEKEKNDYVKLKMLNTYNEFILKKEISEKEEKKQEENVEDDDKEEEDIEEEEEEDIEEDIEKEDREEDREEKEKEKENEDEKKEKEKEKKEEEEKENKEEGKIEDKKEENKEIIRQEVKKKEKGIFKLYKKKLN